jgi:hypothetical protein
VRVDTILLKCYNEIMKIWNKLRVRDGVPLKPCSKYRVYEGEDVRSSLNRIPFLRGFIWQYDQYTVLHNPFFDARSINSYLGRMELKVGSKVSLEIINELLKLAKERGDI